MDAIHKNRPLENSPVDRALVSSFGDFNSGLQITKNTGTINFHSQAGKPAQATPLYMGSLMLF